MVLSSLVVVSISQSCHQLSELMESLKSGGSLLLPMQVNLRRLVAQAILIAICENFLKLRSRSS